MKYVLDKVIIFARKKHIYLMEIQFSKTYFMGTNTKYTQSCLAFTKIATTYVYRLDKGSLELGLLSQI